MSYKPQRHITTPSLYAKQNYLYVQEAGTLISYEPHISRRRNLSSYLFFLVLSGSGIFTYRGREYSLAPGHCIYIDCRIPYSHESSAQDPWTLMWVHFHGHDAGAYYDNYSQSCPAVFAPSSLLPFQDCLEQIYHHSKNLEPLSELLCNKYLLDLITLCHLECQPAPRPNGSTYDKLAQIRSYLDTHFAQTIHLDELTEQFFVSKYHLTREYRKRYGITIMEDLQTRRISHAKSRLRYSRDSIEEIALSCGFQDAGYFIKVFKKAETLTPQEYRRKWSE